MNRDAIKATLRTTVATLQGTLDAMLAEDAQQGTRNRTTDRKAVRTTDGAPLMIGLYEARYEAPTKSERAAARPVGGLSPASINARNRTLYETTEGV